MSHHELCDRPLKLGLPRFPFLIFLLMICISLILGFGIIYFTVAANRRGDYLSLNNDVLSVNIPINWFALTWESSNRSFGGKVFSLIVFHPNKFSAISIQIYDKAATERFFAEENLSDPAAVAYWDVKRFFDWILEKNENASVISIVNGTAYAGASENIARYSKILIRNGFKSSDGKYYNISCIVFSFMNKDNLVRIAFWGKQEDYEETSEVFQRILSDLVVKGYGGK